MSGVSQPSTSEDEILPCRFDLASGHVVCVDRDCKFRQPDLQWEWDGDQWVARTA